MITDKVDAWLTIDEVADLLGISSGKVRRLIDEHILFSYKVEKEPMVPANLIVDGEPLSSIRGTMILLLDLGLSLQEAITWLYEVNDELGTEPISALLAGHKAPVRRAAQGLG
ncbi:MAG: helix-turn-helix domain-containing protein [Micrococcales bacterium]|nr:helix-turn-helix domain-containing protein [Micrococcales bacterium]MDG1818027.1 Rv2175c family DNA-binding protein [Aquiluna sp.]MBT5398266.1 helix-turn-helix domain-containing protein [Micrococcales bacterium]MBT5431635.1 helix-turn-helix domain-containing protein [Micrococcales bacterium]MBT5848552.1 helix-turn-helix domain-containing protein [Micrococcales bacterium]